MPKVLQAAVGKAEMEIQLGGDRRLALMRLPAALAVLQSQISAAATETRGGRTARSPVRTSQSAASSDCLTTSFASMDRVFNATTPASHPGGAAPRYADELRRRHAALGKHVGDIARTRKIVRDATEEKSHD